MESIKHMSAIIQDGRNGVLPRFKNRGRNTVIAELLRATKVPTARTRLMYKANLSYTMLNDYLKMMVDLDLVSIEKSTQGRSYLITERGLKFLEIYDSLIELSSPIQGARTFSAIPE
jgi:predicted transcriptional regulator